MATGTISELSERLTESRPSAFSWSTALRFGAVVFLFGALVGTALHWPAVQEYGVYKEDIVQSPHWAAYHSSSFQPDDLVLQYAHYNESPLQNAIYWVGTRFIDYIPLTKLLAVASYGLLCFIFFQVGYAMRGVRLGLLMAFCVLLIQENWDYSPGFFSKFWMTPVLLLCVYCLQERRWRGFMLLLPFGALAYPMSAVLTGFTVCVYAVIARMDRRPDRMQFIRSVTIGALLAIGLLSLKYVSPPEMIGPMRSGVELRAMPEVAAGGYPSRYLPIPPLSSDLLSHINSPLFVLCTLLFFFVLGRKVAWDRAWTALLLASMAGYVLADHFFMRLYIPNRYTRHSILVLFALWIAFNCDLILGQIKRSAWRKATVAALVAGGLWIYWADFEPPSGASDWGVVAPVSRFIREELPSDVLIAGSPRILDSVMIQGKRSALTPFKLAHPWFVDYYAEIKERTRATLRAHFATSAEPVDELHHRYGATHFLLERKLLDQFRQGERFFVAPYEDEIRESFQPWKQFVFLKKVAEDRIVYEGDHFILYELPLSASLSAKTD